MKTEHYIPTWAETQCGRQARHEQRKRDEQTPQAIERDVDHRRRQAEALYGAYDYSGSGG